MARGTIAPKALEAPGVLAQDREPARAVLDRARSLSGRSAAGVPVEQEPTSLLAQDRNPLARIRDRARSLAAAPRPICARRTRGEWVVYTSGVWVVKEGRENDFASTLAGERGRRLSLEFPDVTFRLLRDPRDPRRFVSLGEGWRNAEQIEAARSFAGYQDCDGVRSGGCSSRATCRRSISSSRSARPGSSGSA